MQRWTRCRAWSVEHRPSMVTGDGAKCSRLGRSPDGDVGMTAWLAPLRAPQRASKSITAGVVGLARSLAGSPGRRRRRVWRREGRAHIEVRAVEDQDRNALIKEIQEVLEAAPGVRWT